MDQYYIENLGWNRLGLHSGEMMDVMEDREVWRLNLKLLEKEKEELASKSYSN